MRDRHLAAALDVGEAETFPVEEVFSFDHRNGEAGEVVVVESLEAGVADARDVGGGEGRHAGRVRVVWDVVLRFLGAAATRFSGVFTARWRSAN